MTLSGREIANDVQTLCRSSDIFVGEAAAIRNRSVRPRDFNNDDADLLISCRNLGRRKISRRDVVVIPEAEIDHLAAWEQLPHLRRENSKVRSRIGGRFG